MNCPKCNRKIPDGRMSCMYCGASLSRNPVSNTSVVLSSDDGFYVQREELEQKVEQVDISELPADLRAKVAEAIKSGQKTVIIKDDIKISDSPANGAPDYRNELPLDKALAVLQGIKRSHQKQHIGAAQYKQMVVDIIQQHLGGLDDRSKIQFVVNDIQKSEFINYLSDDMLNALRGEVIKTISQTR